MRCRTSPVHTAHTHTRLLVGAPRIGPSIRVQTLRRLHQPSTRPPSSSHSNIDRSSTAQSIDRSINSLLARPSSPRPSSRAFPKSSRAPSLRVSSCSNARISHQPPGLRSAAAAAGGGGGGGGAAGSPGDADDAIFALSSPRCPSSRAEFLDAVERVVPKSTQSFRCERRTGIGTATQPPTTTVDWRRLRSRLPRSTLSRAGCCPGESVAERTSPKICEDPRFDNALFGVAHESPRDARLSTLLAGRPCRRFNPLPRIPPRISKTKHILSILSPSIYIYIHAHKTIDRLCRGISSSTWCYAPIVFVASTFFGSRTITDSFELLLRNVIAVVLFHATI